MALWFSPALVIRAGLIMVSQSLVVLVLGCAKAPDRTGKPVEHIAQAAIGSWRLDMGASVEANWLETLRWRRGLNAVQLLLTLQDGGTARLSDTQEGMQGWSVDGSWDINNGNAVTVDFGGRPVTLKMIGDDLEGDVDKQKLVFRRTAIANADH